MFADLSAFDETLFDGAFDDHFGSPTDYLDRLHHLQKMKVSVEDCGDRCNMRIYLKGYQKEQIHVELDGTFLLVSATRPEGEGGQMVSCLRRFYVGGITPEDIHSRFENEELSISVPKQDTDERPATVKIPID